MINAVNSHVTDQCMADSRALYKGTKLWHCVLATEEVYKKCIFSHSELIV